MWCLIEMGHWIGQQRWECSQEIKSDDTGSKFGIHVRGVTEEIANRGNVGTAVDELLDIMPTEVSEGILGDTKEERSCEEKDGEVIH